MLFGFSFFSRLRHYISQNSVQNRMSLTRKILIPPAYRVKAFSMYIHLTLQITINEYNASLLLMGMRKVNFIWTDSELFFFFVITFWWNVNITFPLKFATITNSIIKWSFFSLYVHLVHSKSIHFPYYNDKGRKGIHNRKKIRVINGLILFSLVMKRGWDIFSVWKSD